MQLDHLNAYHIGVDLAGNNQDASVQLPVPLLHLGQYRYTAKDYISIVNSYWYKEKCIFKPRTFMQVVIAKVRFNASLLIASQMARLPYGLKRIRRSREEAVYVLNYGKDNPFYGGNEHKSALYKNMLNNYKLYRFILEHECNDELERDVKRFISSRRIPVSNDNKARLIMLGIRV